MFIAAFSILLFILSDVLQSKILYYIGIILILFTTIVNLFFIDILVDSEKIPLIF